MIGLILLTILLFVLILALLWSNAAEISRGRMMMIASFSVAAGLGLPTMIIGKIAESRRKKLVEQFPVALDVFVRGLRAGHPVASALELVTTEMVDPIGSEFGIVLDEVTYGLELRDALQNMADRRGRGHADVRRLAVDPGRNGRISPRSSTISPR